MQEINYAITLQKLLFSGGNAREPIFITDTNRVLFHDKKESASIARIKTRPPLAFLNNEQVVRE